MSDPCWLPSAIMQTTGALLGIYAVIYVLVVQALKKDIPVFESKRFDFINFGVIDLLFFFVAILGLITIYANALRLVSLTTGLTEPTNWLVTCLAANAWELFEGTLFFIGFYTLFLIWILRLAMD